MQQKTRQWICLCPTTGEAQLITVVSFDAISISTSFSLGFRCCRHEIKRTGGGESNLAHGRAGEIHEARIRIAEKT